MNDAEIRAKVDVGDGGSFTRLGRNIKNVDKQAEYLKIKIDDIKRTLARADAGFQIGDTVKLESQLVRLENQYDKLTNVQEVYNKSLEKGMSKGVKSIKRFGLSLFGIQSIWRMVSKASSSYLQQDTETANKIQAAWVGLGSFLAPVLEGIANLVLRAVKYLNAFISGLTGVDYIARATTKAMDKLNKVTSKTSQNLGSLDEIVNIGGTSEGLANTNWINALNETGVNENTLAWMTELGSRIGGLKDAFNELDPVAQNILKLLGLGGLVAILTGNPGLLIGFAAVGLAVLGLTKIFDKDLTVSVEGLYLILGSAGLIGLLTGNWGLAAAIGLVGTAFFGLNEMMNGDTTQAIEGIILLLGSSYLLGALIGKSGIGLAIGSVITAFQGFADLLSGDVDREIKGFIKLVTGTAGLIFALGLIKGGLAGVNFPLLITVAGFVALGAGIYAVTSNWSKMSGLERVVSVLGLLAIAAATAAAAVGALQSAWTLGIAAAAIAGGVAAISYSISSANKRAQENIPKLSTGTGYVPNEGLYHLHPGEAVIPKRFNSQEYFGNGNEETNNLLRQLNETLIEKDMNAYISPKAIGSTSSAYQKQQDRIMGW